MPLPVYNTVGNITVPYGPGWNSQTHSYNSPTTAVSPTAGPAVGGYNVNPGPGQGNGAYGLVPGPTGIPPSTFQQSVNAVPGLGGATSTQLTNNIMAELEGQINPQALKNMQDAAAAFGVGSGMPGSNATPGTLAFNANLRNIGLDTQAVQRQGGQDYLSTLAGVGQQQLSPALLAEISAHNAQLGAAPNPQVAAEQQLQNYWAALNAMRGPGGGTGMFSPSPSMGTGAFAPSPMNIGTPGASPFVPSVTPAPWSLGPSGGTTPWSSPDLSNQSAWDFTNPTNWNFDLGSGSGLDFGNNIDQSLNSLGDLSGQQYYDALTNPEDYYNQIASVLGG